MHVTDIVIQNLNGKPCNTKFLTGANSCRALGPGQGLRAVWGGEGQGSPRQALQRQAPHGRAFNVSLSALSGVAGGGGTRAKGEW